MNFPRSLSTNLLLIISIPLLVQVGFIWMFSRLSGQIDELTRSEKHCRQVIEHVHCISTLVIMTGFSALEYGVSADKEYIHLHEKFDKMIKTEMASLSQLYPSPEEQASLKELAAAADKLKSVCDVAFIKENANVPVATRLACPGVKPNWTLYFGTRQKILDREMAREQEIATSLEKAREDMRNATYLAVTVDAILAVGLMWMATRHILSRLRIVSDNARKFAKGETLHPPLQSGKDEIYELDNTFHAMANALKEAMDREYKQARTDALTGLPNRRYFVEQADQQFQIAKRYEQPFSILICDIDHFKSINDRYGHPTGDEALKVISEAIRSVTRKADIVARWGGEEFIMALPETTLEGCGIFAERLRNAALESRVPLEDGGTLQFTISIGCSFAEGLDSMEQAIKLADDALYRAKRDGRNRVAMASDNQAVTQKF